MGKSPMAILAGNQPPRAPEAEEEENHVQRRRGQSGQRHLMGSVTKVTIQAKRYLMALLIW